MERKSSIGDTTDQTPERTFEEQNKLQSHLHSHTNPMDQPHKHHDVSSTSWEAGRDSFSASEDELSPDLINPIIFGQDGSSGIVQRDILPQNSSEELDLPVFDVGSSTYTQPRLTSFEQQTPPLVVCKPSQNSTGMIFTSSCVLELHVTYMCIS